MNNIIMYSSKYGKVEDYTQYLEANISATKVFVGIDTANDQKMNLGRFENFTGEYGAFCEKAKFIE